MSRNILETIIGAVVLLVAGGFLLFAYQSSSIQQIDGYRIHADFSDISGVTVGSDVRIGGIKIGVVDGTELNPNTYQATLWLQIKGDVLLPKDSSAVIASSGLLGDKYVKLDPGGSEAMLADGEAIRFTQASISFEELIGKYVFSGGGVASETPATENDSDDASANSPFSTGL